MLISLVAALAGVAWGEDGLDGDVRWATMRADDGGTLVLKHTTIEAEITAGLARVTLDQTFANPYDTAIEATYLLPLPDDAAVDRLDISCGGRHIVGKVMERGAARKTYDDAVASGRKAALLEQQRDDLFTQKVAGICPNETVEVTVGFVAQVKYEDGKYGLTLPMTVGPRYTTPRTTDAASLQTPYVPTDAPASLHAGDVDVTVRIDEGMPVESIWSDTHEIVVPQEDATGALVALSHADAIPNRDFTLGWTLAGKQPRAGVVVTPPDANGDGYVALTMEPRILEDVDEQRPRELLFVLDASGSMGGEPWLLATSAVSKALDQMRPGDTFDVMTFSDSARAFEAAPVAASADNVAAAKAWMAGAYDGGGTAMEWGLLKSLGLPKSDRLRLVLMLTDGYIGDDRQMLQLVRDHLGASRLFALGIGSSPNHALLDGLAEMGRGQALYQTPAASVDDTVDTFAARIAHPSMTDVAVDWHGAQVTGQYPSVLPDLWAGEPVRVVAKYHGKLPDEITLTGDVAGEPYRLTVPLTTTSSASAVPTLWARRKISDLERHATDLGDAEAKRQILDVALAAGLVSPYTSLVATDDQPSKCGTPQLSVDVPHELPEGMDPAFAQPPAGIGGLIGAGGYGAGAYGVVGGGLGGGGTAEGLGGLGTKGIGAGASGYGTGGGNFGAKAEGGITTVEGDPIILGSIDKSLIDEVIKRHMNQIRYCYQRELQKNPSLGGKVVVKFVIAKDGTVSSAVIKSTTLNATEVESCVAGRFLRMQFPAPAGGGIVVVSYPFQFSAQ